MQIADILLNLIRHRYYSLRLSFGETPRSQNEPKLRVSIIMSPPRILSILAILLIPINLRAIKYIRKDPAHTSVSALSIRRNLNSQKPRPNQQP
jgi:hypothetical protein